MELLELFGKEEHKDFLKKYSYEFYEDNVCETIDELYDILNYGYDLENQKNITLSPNELKSYILFNRQEIFAMRREFHLKSLRATYSQLTVVDQQYQNQGWGKYLIDLGFQTAIKQRHEVIIFNWVLSEKVLTIIQKLTKSYNIPVFCRVDYNTHTKSYWFNSENNILKEKIKNFLQ